MKQRAVQFSVQIFLFLVLILTFAPLAYSAESTADVPVDAAMKEKLRQQAMGGAAAHSEDAEYRVGYRDILNVTIYGEGSMAPDEGIQPETSSPGTASSDEGAVIRGRGKGIEVRNDGRISLKHIGDVSVVGMTLTQLADYLKQLYKAIYDNPGVTVTLVQSNSQQYTVMGQVLHPGLYHLDFPLTIVRAVARAGGFTEWAKSAITVIRQEADASGKADGKTQGKTFEFDYDDFLKGQNLDKNITIKPGDVVVVH